MGFWGSSNSSSSSRGDELDFGSKWAYEEIRGYIEDRIGLMDVNDNNLQDKLSKLLEEDKVSLKASGDNAYAVYSYSSFGGWKTRPLDIEVKHVSNNTYLRGSDKNDIDAIRSQIKRIGFSWNRREKTWMLENRLLTVDEIKKLMIDSRAINCTEGLRAYCEKIAYRQSMEGIPNTFSVSDKMDHDVGIDDKCTECGKEIPLLRRKALPSAKTCVNCSSPEDSKDKIDISESKSSDNPYSKVEQLEKLIALRNKGEISPEEFDNLKKELLS
jgi:hypothetical protein